MRLLLLLAHATFITLNSIRLKSILYAFIITKITQHLQYKNVEGFELESFINLVDRFQYDINFESLSIINQCFDCVSEIADLENFERLESIFLDYDEIVMEDESVKDKIYEILAEEADQTEDDYEDIMIDLISRAEKYNLEYAEIKKTLENKIEMQSQNSDNYDWNEENLNNQNSDFITDKEINNIFESLRPDNL